jgi:hypothetical protein
MIAVFAATRNLPDAEDPAITARRALEDPLTDDSAKYLRAYLRDRGRDEFRRLSQDVRFGGALAQLGGV